MHPGKGVFKVLTLVMVVAVILTSLPATTSRPIKLNKFGADLIQVTDDIGNIFSKIHVPFGPANAPTPTVTEVVQKITAEVDPDKDNEIKSPSGKITLTIPKGAVSTTSEIDFSEYGPQASSGMVMLSRFELTATDKATGTAFSKFNQNLQIYIQNDPSDITGVDPNSIRLYYQNETTKQWVPIANSKFDPQTNTLTATTNHFTNYSVQGNPLQVGPGRIMASQVNLNSGSATFSYPIELPPGPGGFQPKLNLNYNSASVDEMKNKQDVGSWVGIGWSLDFGSISYDANTDSYYLNINDSSYQLIATDQTQKNYHTNPEQYYKITRSGNTWNVYDKDGILYQFDGTSDSEQYLYNTCYRWDMNLIQDTNGNQATMSYVQNIKVSGTNTWVRSADPASLNYGSIQVLFNSSYDQNNPNDGYLRNDDPQSYGSNPAPLVMENRKLNSISINVGEALIRQYNFTYNTTNSNYSSDYGGIYYAGALSLASLTQIGADGVSQMPQMTFSYQNLQTGYQDSIDPTYSGDPGNPASFNWPHLTIVNNGYGGSTTFTYTQIPNSTTANVWTREAVTQKTVADGIGPNETTQYAYTGNPQYYGTGLGEQFRGWNEVIETDAAGNYVQHWFYTTGTINGNNAEKLTGNEYETDWYNSVGSLLKQKTYKWSWSTVFQQTDGNYITEWNAAAPNPSYPGYGYYFSAVNGVAVSPDGYVYVVGTTTSSKGSTSVNVVKYDANGNYITEWNIAAPNPNYPNYPYYFSAVNGVAVSPDGYVYVVGTTTCYKSPSPTVYVVKYDASGNYITEWQNAAPYNPPYYYYISAAKGVAISPDGSVYVAGTIAYRGTNNGDFIIKYDSNGNYITWWQNAAPYNPPYYYYISAAKGVAISQFGYVYTAATLSYKGVAQGDYIVKYSQAQTCWAIQLNQVDETTGSKTSQTRYSYDSYGNVVTEYDDGDTSTNADDSTIWRAYDPNTTANILDKPARERTYATAMSSDSGGANLRQETDYNYDNQANGTAPTKGNLTSQVQWTSAFSSVTTSYTYDSYGNKLTETDGNGNTTTWTYDSTYHTYPATKTDPISGLSESYTYDPGTNNLLTSTDVNGQVTSYYYDTFKRLTSVVKPGDSQGSPSITYQYNSWGTLNSQNVETITKIDATHSIWSTDYFDGLGRVVQTQTQSETAGHTFVSSTTAFSNCGQVSQQYVSQDIASTLTTYQAPQSGWQSTTYTYDGLGRVVTQTNPDGTSTSNDYSQPWQTNVTNAKGLITKDYYDAFNRLVEVQEPNSDNSVYTTTNYTYDVLGNLIQVVDANSNTTTMAYDWLSRKTGMTDPDMGTWSYGYDNNGNLTSQTDAKGQTITMVYDAMNRLTNKNYPAGSGMTNIVYSYDSTAGGNYGKGLRTGMTDASGTTNDVYDNRGRLAQETKTISSVPYTTAYTYDGLDRVATVTYPTGETVTNTYNGRGLPSTVSGSSVGNLVTNTLYNQLGNITEIDLNNGLKTTYGYYGTGGTYDTTGGYYGQLWEIKTLPQGGGTSLQDLQYTWDANGNLTQRQNLVSSQTENFTYDSLDRLTGVSGAYNQSYAYNTIGNITSMNGTNYSYGSQPQAVTAIGSTSYAYDANGNMTTRGTQTLTWDVENRPVAISGGASFVYDGDGNRVEQTENGQTTLYINQYYEINITTGVATTYYYLGGQLVAQNVGGTLKYIHQDSLGSTSVMSTSTGTLDSSISFYPFGATWAGSINTTKEFTGQRLDQTGLYYYNARYYDPTIGRFISPDNIVSNPFNPQSLNRYSYCLNNPLEYTDPTGHINEIYDDIGPTINTKIVDKVVTYNGGFTTSSGLVPGYSLWSKLINIGVDIVYTVGSWEGIENSGLSESDSSSNIGVSAMAEAYHSSSGSNGVEVSISSSVDISYKVTLWWMVGNQQQRDTMNPVDSNDGISIVPYSSNSNYDVESNNIVNENAGSGTASIIYQPKVNCPFITNSIGVPNYNSQALQSMWVTISPYVPQSSDQSADLNFSNQPPIIVYLKK